MSGFARYTMERIRARLPGLYRIVRWSYWETRRLAAQLAGTRLEERIWARRGLEDVRRGCGAESHPHRRFLLSRLEVLAPVESLLEVGSGFGPNLELIAARFPAARICGVDINAHSVRVGTQWFTRRGRTNVQLQVGRADDLRQFPDRSFEIVLTDGLLMYVGPDKIRRVIEEFIRAASRALVLVEQHGPHRPDDPYGLGIYVEGRWIRDYVDLLRQFVPADRINLTKVPVTLWPDKTWQDLGYVIHVEVGA